MASKCNVNDWDEIQCISAYMETGDQLVVKGVYQDSFGFPVEGSICLDVRKRTVHMEADQGDRALSADYQLGCSGTLPWPGKPETIRRMAFLTQAAAVWTGRP